MKLEAMTWEEVNDYLTTQNGVILPTGSVEQHGPLGLIGTDTICAREIAWRAAEICDAMVAPELAYSPAPFNMSFPGTISLSPDLYEGIAREVLQCLMQHGFTKLYILNAHGANLAPLHNVAQTLDADIRIRSWWDFEPVNTLRNQWYGDWEGMHATPSETSITQATHRIVIAPDLPPPTKLSPAYIAAHAGDKHGPPDQHRRDFPDGRVGSHSGLATPDHGHQLLATAAQAVANDFNDFTCSHPRPSSAPTSGQRS